MKDNTLSYALLGAALLVAAEIMIGTFLPT